MDYEQALAWVHGLKRFAPAPGLERMRKLMAALGNPQGRLRFVHVAGTNGKGSVVTMLANIVKAAGYTVGANVSPYVVDFRERFQVGGEMISETRLAEILGKVRRAVEALAEPVIEFEAVTAAALLWFAEEGCDLVCLEAGIGGRLDSTNVVENTLVACLTRIGLDHTAILGESIEAITAEKCGIFKPGCRVVCYPQQPGAALSVIQKHAAEKQCTLTVAEMPEPLPDAGTMHPYLYKYKRLRLEPALVGAHQALNAAVVAETAWALRRHGYSIADADIEQGVRETRLPARIELLRRQPSVIVDGAHNVDSASALAAFLEREHLSNLTAVAGILDDKDAGQVLELMAPYVGSLCTVRPDSPRALDAVALAARAVALGYTRVTPYESIEAALNAAVKGERGVLVFGSFYLAARARQILSEYSDLKG
ncbi:MAG: bifunctional folylpolyglutamate synthase/dihydrofolate synthase [Ruminococcaceae bacterium]|nr:bifunctional folylpolyglutamate synthase/dihydrofolate synthase [Oscillospiraceae bacterium]